MKSSRRYFNAWQMKIFGQLSFFSTFSFFVARENRERISTWHEKQQMKTEKIVCAIQQFMMSLMRVV
jgi:hypothetical protein